MHFMLNQLPNFVDIKVWVNFFTEYHSKSIVDGHFGLLSRWFSEGEKVQPIKNINDLLRFFISKTNQSSLKINFEIYSCCNIVHIDIAYFC